MSNLRLITADLPTYEEWVKELDRLNGSRIGHNTYAHNMDETGVVITYHSTAIVTFRPDGTVRLRNGGWATSTTKNRLNLIGGARWGVHQKNYEWTVTLNRKWDEPIEWEDGMVLPGWSFFDRVDTDNVCDLL